jgi:hypothetical protein
MVTLMETTNLKEEEKAVIHEISKSLEINRPLKFSYRKVAHLLKRRISQCTYNCVGLYSGGLLIESWK